jgi:hypothetical protein
MLQSKNKVYSGVKQGLAKQDKHVPTSTLARAVGSRGIERTNKTKKTIRKFKVNHTSGSHENKSSNEPRSTKDVETGRANQGKDLPCKGSTGNPLYSGNFNALYMVVSQIRGR